MVYGMFFVGCGSKRLFSYTTMSDRVKTFDTEVEKFAWLSSKGHQPMTISIRCTFELAQRQCYLGASKNHPISIDDTRLGIPLSEQQTSDGWVQVEGVWNPEPAALSIDQVDLRIEKVLSTSPTPLVVMVQ